MKKLLTIFILSACAIVRADDWADLLALAEQADAAVQAAEARAVVAEAGRYVELRVFQLEANPAFMGTRFAYPNTFLWYIWNDYDAAQGFEKLHIGEQIEKFSH